MKQGQKINLVSLVMVSLPLSSEEDLHHWLHSWVTGRDTKGWNNLLQN